MQYTVTYNGATCQLPKLTKNVKKKIEETNQKISNMQIPLDNRMDAMYGFLLESVGEEYLTRALGSADLDEVDMNDVNILYLKITKEYDRPLVEFNRPEMDSESKKVLQDLDKAAKNITVIQQATAK